MRYTLFLILILSNTLAFGQTDTFARYLDYQLKETTQDKAQYETICLSKKIEDGNWLVQDYYASSGKIMMRSYFSDSSFKKQVGTHEQFYKDGKPWVKGSFADGVKIGIWKRWHENGRISDSTVYNERGIRIGLKKSWSSTGRLHDSASYDPDGSGIGNYYSWFESGTLSDEGQMNNEKKVGKWNFYQRSGKKASEVVFEADSAISITCFDNKGSVISGNCVAEMDSDYPSGITGWQKYIANRVYGASEELNKSDANGTAVVSFIVDTTGKVTDVTLYKKTDTFLDEFALRVIKSSPKWKPALLYNVPVMAYRRQPISFQLEE